MEYDFIKLGTPEEVGIKSEWINSFLKRLDDINYDIHSLQIVKDEKLVFAKAVKPYELNEPHRLLSAAKPIIACAVLFAIDEGKLSFDSLLVDYFPEYVSSDIDERMKRITLYDLLTMQTGQNRDDAFGLFLANPNINLCEAFFKTPMDCEPRTQFFYNNAVPHLLFFIVERATKENIVDYLKRKLADPLGMEIIAQNDESGIYNPVTTTVTHEGFLKFAYFIKNYGAWNGKQLINPELIKMACTQQVWTGNTDEGYGNSKGYCMQIWKNAFGGCRMDGGGGQIAFILPEANMLVLVMGNEYRVDTMMKYMYEEIYSKVAGRSFPANEKSYEMHNEYELLNTAWSRLELFDHNKQIDYEWQLCNNEYGISSISLRRQKENLEIILTINNEKYNYMAGLNNNWIKNNQYFIVTPDTSIQNMMYGMDANECYLSAGLYESDIVIILRSKASMGYYKFILKEIDSERKEILIPKGISAGMKKDMGYISIKGTTKRS